MNTNTNTNTNPHTYAYSYIDSAGHHRRTEEHSTPEDAWCDMMTQDIDWDQGEPLLQHLHTVTTPGPQA